MCTKYGSSSLSHSFSVLPREDVQKDIHVQKDFLKIIYLFIYLFLAALSLRSCTRGFSSCDEWGLLFVAVRGLLIAVASLVALVVEHRL